MRKEREVSKTFFSVQSKKAYISAEGLSLTPCVLMNEHLCTAQSTCDMCIHVVETWI